MQKSTSAKPEGVARRAIEARAGCELRGPRPGRAPQTWSRFELAIRFGCPKPGPS